MVVIVGARVQQDMNRRVFLRYEAEEDRSSLLVVSRHHFDEPKYHFVNGIVFFFLLAPSRVG